MPKIFFKKTRPDAVVPQYMTVGSVGMDLITVEGASLLPGMTAYLPTGLQVQLPVGYEMQIRPRSGLSFQYPNYIMNSPGTIDTDYRGEILIMVMNNSKLVWEIRAGDRIAQAVIAPIIRPIVYETAMLDTTDRGSGRFGSTGV